MDAEDFANSLINLTNDIDNEELINVSGDNAELLNDASIADNTNFTSAGDMLSKSGFENIDQFATNPPEKNFFSLNTRFASFDEMVIAANQVMAEQVFLDKHFGEPT